MGKLRFSNMSRPNMNPGGGGQKYFDVNLFGTLKVVLTFKVPHTCTLKVHVYMISLPCVSMYLARRSCSGMQLQLYLDVNAIYCCWFTIYIILRLLLVIKQETSLLGSYTIATKVKGFDFIFCFSGWPHISKNNFPDLESMLILPPSDISYVNYFVNEFQIYVLWFWFSTLRNIMKKYWRCWKIIRSVIILIWGIHYRNWFHLYR